MRFAKRIEARNESWRRRKTGRKHDLKRKQRQKRRKATKESEETQGRKQYQTENRHNRISQEGIPTAPLYLYQMNDSATFLTCKQFWEVALHTRPWNRYAQKFSHTPLNQIHQRAKLSKEQSHIKCHRLYLISVFHHLTWKPWVSLEMGIAYFALEASLHSETKTVTLKFVWEWFMKCYSMTNSILMTSSWWRANRRTLCTLSEDTPSSPLDMYQELPSTTQWFASCMNKRSRTSSNPVHSVAFGKFMPWRQFLVHDFDLYFLGEVPTRLICQERCFPGIKPQSLSVLSSGQAPAMTKLKPGGSQTISFRHSINNPR